MKTKKTGSLLNVPGEQKISEIDDWGQIIKLMIYNDERIIKSNLKKLATVLNNIKEAKMSNVK